MQAEADWQGPRPPYHPPQAYPSPALAARGRGFRLALKGPPDQRLPLEVLVSRVHGDELAVLYSGRTHSLLSTALHISGDRP